MEGLQATWRQQHGWTDSENSGAGESQTCRTISTAVLFCCGSRWKTLLAANSVTLASSVSTVTCQGSPQLYMFHHGTRAEWTFVAARPPGAGHQACTRRCSMWCCKSAGTYLVQRPAARAPRSLHEPRAGADARCTVRRRQGAVL